MTLNRRRFLKGAAGPTFIMRATGLGAVRSNAATGPIEANHWVTIQPDGHISVIFPSTEMGQSSWPTLPQILAEELEADWKDVEIIELNKDDRRHGNQFFGGVFCCKSPRARGG